MARKPVGDYQGRPPSTTRVAKRAVNELSSHLKDKNGRGMYTNDLDAYLSKQLRKDYKQFTDYGAILKRYNKQSDTSYALSKAEQKQAMNLAEVSNYANTQNAIAQMRNQLAGSASSGASQGAANATALQALLGLGQQNSATTTEGMQAYQNVAREAMAARAANAVTALDSAREGTNSMYDQATSAYGADHTYGVQGVADAYGQVAAGMNADRANYLAALINASSQERMNRVTAKSNEKIANTTTKSVSKNYNYNRK